MPLSPGATGAASIRERIAALTPRERRFLLVGAGVLLLFLVYVLWPSGEGEEVELAPASPMTTTSVTAPPPAPLPPITTVSAPPPADASAAAGIILRGVMGGGPRGGAAIFAYPDGGQRVVRVGRDLVPGLTLRAIGVRHAIASGAGGDIRLELNKAGGVAVAAAAPTVAAPAGPGAGSGGPREAMQYRLGLAPHKVEGRTRGYAIRPGATLPMLQRAGLRPGDILVAVNGQALESDEKVLDLPGEIAGAYTAEFEFIRGGKRMKASMEINKRPT